MGKENLIKENKLLKNEIEFIKKTNEILSLTGSFEKVFENLSKYFIEFFNINVFYIYYADHFENMHLFNYNKPGFILDKKDNDSILKVAKTSYKRNENIILVEKTKDRIVAIPINKNNGSTGIIGIYSSNFTDDVDIIIKMLDSVLKSIERFILTNNKENTLYLRSDIMTKIDSIIDKNSIDISDCLEKIINSLVLWTHSDMGFILDFDNDQNLKVVFADHKGFAAIETRRGIEEFIIEISRRSLDNKETISEKCNELKDKFKINSEYIAVFPLITALNDHVGAFFMIGSKPYTDVEIMILQESARISDNLIIENKRKEKIINSCSNFIGEEILDIILKNPSYLNPAEKNIAILTVDVCDSTSFSDSEKDKAKVYKVINDYLVLIAKEIISSNGYLDKYVGDEVIGLFGAPVEQENDLFNALDTALRIKNKIEKFNNLKIKDELKLKVRTSINYGKMVAGIVGSHDTKASYSVIGIQCNLAFRIRPLAEPGHICVTDSVYKLAKDKYNMKIKGEFSVKGIEEPVKIYDLIGLKGDKD